MLDIGDDKHTMPFIIAMSIMHMPLIFPIMISVLLPIAIARYGIEARAIPKYIMRFWISFLS
jgi:hypothetical protein